MGADSMDSGNQGRRRPRALLWALALILVIEAIVAMSDERFANGTVLLYREKLRWADGAASGDVLVFGDSSAVAAVRPSEIESYLPADTRVLNFGLTATGPTGSEIVLRRYLDTHEPPWLVVLSYAPRSLTDDPPEFFVKYALTHLIGPGDIVRVSYRSSDPKYLLIWGLSRIPSYRYREDLGTASLSLLFGSFPALEPHYYQYLGWEENPTNDYRFRWFYHDRVGRNRGLLESLREEGGWHYFKEYAIPGEVLPADLPLYSPPFEGVRREAIALDALLTLCDQEGIPVLVVPSARPAARWASLQAEDGAERFAQFWRVAFTRHPTVRHTAEQAVGWPHRFFSDGAHLNPEGASRYAELVGPIVARALARSAEPPAAAGP
jgi:hypothetical protein